MGMPMPYPAQKPVLNKKSKRDALLKQMKGSC